MGIVLIVDSVVSNEIFAQDIQIFLDVGLQVCSFSLL